MTRSEFISKVGNYTTEVGTGVFPSVVLAQAILESDNGNSALASKHNNYFGIKADPSWTGQKVNMQTGEVFNGERVTIGAWFRVYKNPGESFRDHSKFLKENPRYQKAGVFKASTPEAQADALQKAGYATDPKYAWKLKSIIAGSNLKRFDLKKKCS